VGLTKDPISDVPCPKCGTNLCGLALIALEMPTLEDGLYYVSCNSSECDFKLEKEIRNRGRDTIVSQTDGEIPDSITLTKVAPTTLVLTK
jgi:hypothetical protein